MPASPLVLCESPLTLKVDDGLILRQLTLGDVAEYHQRLNDPTTKLRLQEFLSWPDSEFALEIIRKYIKEAQENFKAGVAMSILGIFRDDQVGGSVNLFNIKKIEGRLEAEMGFFKFFGKNSRKDSLTHPGDVSRCAIALAQYGFKERALDSIVIRCRPENTRANQLAVRIHAHHEASESATESEPAFTRYRLLPEDVGL